MTCKVEIFWAGLSKRTHPVYECVQDLRAGADAMRASAILKAKELRQVSCTRLFRRHLLMKGDGEGADGFNIYIAKHPGFSASHEWTLSRCVRSPGPRLTHVARQIFGDRAPSASTAVRHDVATYGQESIAP